TDGTVRRAGLLSKVLAPDVFAGILIEWLGWISPRPVSPQPWLLRLFLRSSCYSSFSARASCMGLITPFRRNRKAIVQLLRVSTLAEFKEIGGRPYYHGDKTRRRGLKGAAKICT